MIRKLQKYASQHTYVAEAIDLFENFSNGTFSPNEYAEKYVASINGIYAAESYARLDGLKERADNTEAIGNVLSDAYIEPDVWKSALDIRAAFINNNIGSWRLYERKALESDVINYQREIFLAMCSGSAPWQRQ
jgi:alpha-amylase/alpha-mannosidase (GH57 family)